MLYAMLAACATLIFVLALAFLARPRPVAWHASFGRSKCGPS